MPGLTGWKRNLTATGTIPVRHIKKCSSGSEVLKKTTLPRKLDAIDGKLDKLVERQEEQDDKPNKLIDHLKENAINYIMLAMMGLVLLKMGLGA